MGIALSTIRPMQADDVVLLAQSLGWTVEGIERRWREAESGGREILVAEVDGHPTGSVSMNVHDDVPGLLHLFALDVAPAYQRRGIGTALIQRVEDHAVSGSMAGVWLDVEIANEDARRLYERLGYRVEGDVVVNRYTAFPAGEQVEETCYRLFKRIPRTD